MLKAWLPHEGPEITIKVRGDPTALPSGCWRSPVCVCARQEKKSNDEGEEEEEEDEPEEGIEISHEQIKAALKIVPRDKLAALLKQSLELLDSRPAEFTMQVRRQCNNRLLVAVPDASACVLFLCGMDSPRARGGPSAARRCVTRGPARPARSKPWMRARTTTMTFEVPLRFATSLLCMYV